jgi:hypothetical protein
MRADIMRIDWTGRDADKNDALISLRKQGLSAGQIAKQLGVSRNSVIGRMNRLQEAGTLARFSPAVKKRTAKPVPIKPDWTVLSRDEKHALVSQWREDGLSVRACVARVRNASDSAVRSAAASFGMPFPDGRVGRDQKAAPVYRLDDIRAARDREAIIEAEEQKRLQEVVSAVPLEAPACEPVAFLELENHHCRFVVSPGMHCGGAANLIRREPWCAFHRHIVYEQNPEKRKSA